MQKKTLGVASVALLASAFIAAAAPSASASTQAVAVDQDCKARALAMIPDYLDQQGLPSDTDLFTACTNGVAAVWAPDEKGMPISPLTDEAEIEARNDRSQARAASTTDCTIIDPYKVECEWGTSYDKVSGQTGAIIWTRSLKGYALMNLQVNSHQVQLRYTHNQGIAHNAIGNLILQRQQGILPPTFENDTDFAMVGGSQTKDVFWVNRVDPSAGKYSMIFNLLRIYDKAENAYIPVYGDPTSPRFQCYSDNPEDFWKNCEYPDGKEAPVF